MNKQTDRQVYETPEAELFILSARLSILEVASLNGGIDDLQEGEEIILGEFDEPWG